VHIDGFIVPALGEPGGAATLSEGDYVVPASGGLDGAVAQAVGVLVRLLMDLVKPLQLLMDSAVSCFQIPPHLLQHR